MMKVLSLEKRNTVLFVYWGMTPEPSKTFEERLEEVVKALMR